MKILIGKYGQKIMFDRSCLECQRSNTNGNVGLYKLMKLLFDSNKQDKFFLVSKSIGLRGYRNVIDFSQNGITSINVLSDLDVMVIVAGLGEYEKDERLIDIINKAKVDKFILIAEDPRCIMSMNNDKRLKRIPDIIVTQTDGVFVFKGKQVKMKYIPIQTSECYEETFSKKCSNNDELLLIANTSGSLYNRAKIAASLLFGSGIRYNIYGRLSDDEIKLLNDGNYKGEVNYNEMKEVMQRSFFTLVIPISKGWVTSKYVFALLNNCLPIFYSDFNIELLENDLIKNESLLQKYTVNSKEELVHIVNWCINNKKEVYRDIETLKFLLIEKYVNGNELNTKLMKVIKE